jgi:NAD(P)-dependent dehydrogenase (short-subunit alcohol dehydrogenase family)
MKIEGSVALVTGANRGLGAALADALLDRGAAKVDAAVHAGYLDTDMATWTDGPKTAPDVVASAALDGVEAGEHEVLVDDFARHVRGALSGPLSALYPAPATPAASTR